MASWALASVGNHRHSVPNRLGKSVPATAAAASHPVPNSRDDQHNCTTQFAFLDGLNHHPFIRASASSTQETTQLVSHADPPRIKARRFSVAREWTDWADPSLSDSLGCPPRRLDAQSLLELACLLEVLIHPKQKG
jgi:hypothetical protein